jgi:hypothetical protein
MFRVSTDNGATFKAGVADYAWGAFRIADGTAANDEDASDSEIQLSGLAGLGNVATVAHHGEILIFGAHQDQIFCQIYFNMAVHAFGGAQSIVSGSGSYMTLAKVNAVRILSVGNTDRGRVQLWGIR